MAHKFCQFCEKMFKNIQGLRGHEKSKAHALRVYYINNREQPSTSRVEGIIDVYKSITIKKKSVPTKEICSHVLEESEKILEFVNKERNVKYEIVVKVLLHKINPNTEETNYQTIKIRSFQSYKIGLLDETESNLSRAIREFPNQIDDSLMRVQGSGWSIFEIGNITVNISKIKVLAGRSYIPLPFTSNALLNIENYDNKCFLYCILAHLYPINGRQHPNRVGHYIRHLDELNKEGLSFPVPINEISKFEDNNNFKINVYGLDKRRNSSGRNSSSERRRYQVYPIYISKKEEYLQDIKLLYLKRRNKTHYVYIKDFNRFMKGDLNYNLRSNQRLNICDKCCSYFVTESSFDNHQIICGKNGNEMTRVIMPIKHNNVRDCRICKNREECTCDILKFKNYNYQMPIPFIIVSDIECLNIPVDEKKGKNSKIKFKHQPSCIYLKLISRYPDLIQNEEKMFKGLKCISSFAKYIIENESRFSELLTSQFGIDMTEEDKINFNNSNICIYCNKVCREKVKDHDHYIRFNNFRGAACRECNSIARKPKDFPLYFHNGSKYDFHILIKDLASEINKESNAKQIKVLPLTDEIYISFNYGCVRFTDSLRLFQNSLDKISKSMKHEEFLELRKEFNLLLLETEFEEDYKLLKKFLYMKI